MSSAATGYYHATKFAVEGLSGSLALELAPLGIKVLLIEPGPFRTDFAGRSMGQSHIEIADYAQTAGIRRQQMHARAGNQKGDPARAAQAIIDVVASPNPPARLLLGAVALDLARKDMAEKKRDFDAWEATSRGADYP